MRVDGGGHDRRLSSNIPYSRPVYITVWVYYLGDETRRWHLNQIISNSGAKALTELSAAPNSCWWTVKM